MLFAGDESEILADGYLELIPGYLPAVRADDLYSALLNDCAWEQPSLTLYGKSHPIPRMQSWLGADAINYRYSGQTFTSAIWPAYVKQLAEELSAHCNVQFNSVLANLYRNGEDSMGWHADDEPELGTDPVIASVSLGAERDFAIRRTGVSRQAGNLALPHGSLLIMRAGMQSRWQHSVPKRKRVCEPRINLTFRHISR
ncbi:MAG: alpha-ketoglutarate-dependent dioxygenase AlkB [Thalassolituus sp.]